MGSRCAVSKLRRALGLFRDKRGHARIGYVALTQRLTLGRVCDRHCGWASTVRRMGHFATVKAPIRSVPGSVTGIVETTEPDVGSTMSMTLPLESGDPTYQRRPDAPRS